MGPHRPRRHAGPRPLEPQEPSLVSIVRGRRQGDRQSGVHVLRGLVQPNSAERVLNGKPSEYRLRDRREVNWKPQLAKAIEAFEQNGFFILVDDRQAEGLDDELTIGRGTVVSFVKLTPLVRG